MRTLLVVLLSTVAVLVGLELVLHSRGAWPPGNWAAFGSIGCAALVGVAKWLAGLGLQLAEPADD